MAAIIVERIAPTLPEARRTDLLRSWRSIDGQIKHLTDRLRRAR